LIKGRDNVAWSDLLDYTRYGGITATAKINEGDFDELLAIDIFNGSTLLCFKEQSVWKVEGFYGDLTSAVGPLEVTREYGIAAPGSLVEYGSEKYWWSSLPGMMSLRLTEQNEEQTTAKSLSEPMSETMKRIHGDYVSGIQCAMWKGRLYVAVPLDEARILGPELIPANATYSGGGTYDLLGLTDGAKYVYTQGENDESFNGVVGDITVEMAGTTGVMIGDSSSAVTASVREVLHEGVNNGVMVYDFENRAWCGVDEIEDALAVKAWIKDDYNGEMRLFALCQDGVIRLYEEGFDDEVIETVDVPYVDVIVDGASAPDAPDAIRINGGSVVSADANLATNSGTTWGTSSLSIARSNLWRDANGKGGYDPSSTSPWTCPNATAQEVDWGVRFVATNGTVPTVLINGVAVSSSGLRDWAYVDFVSGSLITAQAVQSEVVTRGYIAQQPKAKRFVAATMLLSTWDPSYTVTSVVDGVGEETDYIADATRDRTKYFTHSAMDYDPTNASDNHEAPYREDYSVVPDRAGFIPGDEGINVEQHQDSNHSVAMNERGNWQQLKIVNTQGRCDLKSVTLETEKGDNGPTGVNVS
jgi:hypothetical protein